MKRVLYLSYDGLTDPLGQSQILPYIVGLEEEGFSFTIISFEKQDRLRSDGKVVEDILKGKNIRWIPFKYSKTPPVAGTLYDLLKMKQKAFEVHEETPFSIIHCRSYLSALIGYQIQKKYGIKFIFDMRGFWADERVEGKIWSLKNPLYRFIYRFFKKQEIGLLKNANHTVALTYKAKEIILGWREMKDQPVSISVIPCCVDMAHFDPEKVVLQEKQRIKEKLGIKKEDKVLTYLGSLGTWYMMDEMLRFFKELEEGNKSYKFLVITKDETRNLVRKACEMKIPLDKIILTSSGREELPAMLSVSHLAISFIRPSFSKQGSSPTKLGELLSMGIPVVCNLGVGDVDFFYKNDLPFLLYDLKKPFTFDEVKAINQKKKKLRDIVGTRCSLEVGCDRYSFLYHKLLKNNK